MLNNEFFLLFLLAHLTGDYALQTDKIAMKKSEGIRGVALHTLIVCLVQLMLLSFFGISGIIAALLGAGIHFFIDCIKIMIGKRLGRMELIYYFIDQGLHLLVIFLLTLVFAPEKSIMGSYILYTKLFIVLILLVYTSTVTAKNVVRNIFPNLKKRKFFEGNERWVDAVTGGFLYASYIIHPWLSLVTVVCGVLVYCKIQATTYKYNLQISLTKFFAIAVFSFLVVLFIRIV